MGEAGRERASAEAAAPRAVRLVSLPAGDTSFVAFHQAHRLDLTAYARVLLGRTRPAEIDDALQDAWMRAWRAWDRDDIGDRLAWMRQIVRNSCMDRHRRRGGDDRSIEEMLPLHVPPGDDHVLDRIEADSAIAALDKLPSALRETLWLRAVGDLRYAEIAEMQGVPVGTVMSRLHAARRKMAAQLSRGDR